MGEGILFLPTPIFRICENRLTVSSKLYVHKRKSVSAFWTQHTLCSFFLAFFSSFSAFFKISAAMSCVVCSQSQLQSERVRHLLHINQNISRSVQRTHNALWCNKTNLRLNLQLQFPFGPFQPFAQCMQYEARNWDPPGWSGREVDRCACAPHYTDPTICNSNLPLSSGR